MSNLIDIQSQIEKLQKQANDIRLKEFDKTVQDILAKMQAFGITVKHLGDAERQRKSRPAASKRGPKAAKVARKAAGKTSVVEPKFRGPNGETWSGRGLTPKWLSALIAEGRTKEEFAIKG